MPRVGGWSHHRAGTNVTARVVAKSVSSNVPELKVPRRTGADSAEIDRCLESAAGLVEGFAERGAAAALDALFAAMGTQPDAAQAHTVAAKALHQTDTLLDEVRRFLSLTKT